MNVVNDRATPQMIRVSKTHFQWKGVPLFVYIHLYSAGFAPVTHKCDRHKGYMDNAIDAVNEYLLAAGWQDTRYHMTYAPDKNGGLIFFPEGWTGHEIDPFEGFEDQMSRNALTEEEIEEVEKHMDELGVGLEGPSDHRKEGDEND